VTTVEGALWIAYLAGWNERGKVLNTNPYRDFQQLDEELKDEVIMKFRAWLKETMG
jgi:hypothetical protein